MSSIMTDFTGIFPYLAGTKFNENMAVTYGGKTGVRYRSDVLIDMCVQIKDLSCRRGNVQRLCFN